MKKQRGFIILNNCIRFLLLALCGGLLGYNLYCINASRVVGDQMPMPFGYGAAVVLSGSMEPALSKGDLILVRQTDSFREGDVVVYQDGDLLVVHRIISLVDGQAITKGDANNAFDDPVELSAIKGEVFLSLPGVGTAVELIKTPVGSLLILGLALLLLELPRRLEKRRHAQELEKIKAEIRRLKGSDEP